MLGTEPGSPGNLVRSAGALNCCAISPAPMPNFHIKDSNSGSQGCLADILPVESSPVLLLFKWTLSNDFLKRLLRSFYQKVQRGTELCYGCICNMQYEARIRNNDWEVVTHAFNSSILVGRGRRISELEASLVYWFSSRVDGATQKNPVSKSKQTDKK